MSPPNSCGYTNPGKPRADAAKVPSAMTAEIQNDGFIASDSSHAAAGGGVALSRMEATMQNTASVPRGRLELGKKKVKQRDKARMLAEARYQMLIVGWLLKWQSSRMAAEIMETEETRRLKMEALRKLIFGDFEEENE